MTFASRFLIRNLLLPALFYAALTLVSSPAKAQDQTVSFLFVQTAVSMTYSEGELVLKGVPSSLFFSDRPKRLAGHMTNPQFVDHWKKSGIDSAPNAVLSLLGMGGDPRGEVVMELLDAPTVEGFDLRYAVKLIEGVLPPQASACSLFIDAFPTAVNSQITD